MNNLQLRDAREVDRKAIQAVTLSAYEQYALPLNGMWELYRANILSTLADVKPAAQIVAETNDGIVATVLLYPAGTQFHTPDGTSMTLLLPEIRLLAVTPRARGQGIATALVQECIHRARQSGAAAITLHTTDMMDVAMRMYERMGFVHESEFDFVPAPGYVAKGFRLDLNVLR